MHVFTYGILMFDPVWQGLVRGRYASREAVLRGYRRLRVKGADYPGLWPGAPEDAVQGRLYLDVAAADLEVLDEFEGPEYDRCLLDCDSSGRSLQAAVYVFRPHLGARLEETEWQPEAFREAALARFGGRDLRR